MEVEGRPLVLEQEKHKTTEDTASEDGYDRFIDSVVCIVFNFVTGDFSHYTKYSSQFAVFDKLCHIKTIDEIRVVPLF